MVVQSRCDSLDAVELAVPFRLRSRADVEGFGADLAVSKLTLPGAVDVVQRAPGHDQRIRELSVRYQDDLGLVPKRTVQIDPQPQEFVPATPRPLFDRLSRPSSEWSVHRWVIDGQPLSAGQSAVFKVRYHVYQPTGIVRWKRSGIGINGAFFEARTGTGAIHRSDPLPDLINNRGVIPKAVTITFVLRASLQLHVGAPHVEPEVIDGRTWEHYLRRVTDLRRAGALVAYTRSATKSAPVDRSIEDGTEESEADEKSEDPRLFLDVSREFGLLPFGNYFRIALLTLAILAFARWIGLIGSGHYTGIPWTHILHNVGSVIGQLGISVGSLLALAFSTKIPKIAKTLSSFRNAWHRFDRWFWRRYLKLADRD